MPKLPVIVWFRVDLRLSDNPALYHAGKTGKPLAFLYIHSEKKGAPYQITARQKNWLHYSLKALEKDLKKRRAQLIIREGDSATILSQIFKETGADEIFWNAEYDPFYLKRDKKLKTALKSVGIRVHTYHGNLLFDPYEILRLREKPCQKFSLFAKTVKTYLSPPKPLPSPKTLHAFSMHLASLKPAHFPKNPAMSRFMKIGESAAKKKLAERKELSAPLAFGEISPREIWHGDVLKKELLEREFMHHILIFFPETPFRSFRKEGKDIRKNEGLLQLWKEGKTGYPFIDAAMRKLKQTGDLSQESREVAATFFVKILKQPWFIGAQHFWEELIDVELAVNCFSWQKCAGVGPDVKEVVFDPIAEGKKLDSEGAFIQTFLPELESVPKEYLHTPWEYDKALDYPKRIVKINS